MKIHRYSAKIILALCSASLLIGVAAQRRATKAAPHKVRTPAKAPAAPSGLAPLVRAYRQSPTPAARTAVTAYAAAHPEHVAKLILSDSP